MNVLPLKSVREHYDIVEWALCNEYIKAVELIKLPQGTMYSQLFHDVLNDSLNEHPL